MSRHYRHIRRQKKTVLKQYRVFTAPKSEPFRIGARNFKNHHLDLFDIARACVKKVRSVVYNKRRKNTYGFIKFQAALLLHGRKKPFWIPGSVPMSSSNAAKSVTDGSGLQLRELAFRGEASANEVRQYNRFMASFIHATLMDFVEAEMAGENPHYVSVGSSQFVFNQNVGRKAQYEVVDGQRVRLPLVYKKINGDENTWDKFKFMRFKVVRFDYQVIEMVFTKPKEPRMRADGREEDVY